MGQTYCMNLCGERGENEVLPLETLMNCDSDEPTPQFAKQVRQHIELNAKIKDIYLQYRTPHLPEKKGIKLELHYLFSYSAYYEGEWKNGLPHGFGRVIYDDGSVYEGCFSNGIANCAQAIFIRRDCSFYRGNIANNKASGEGELRTSKCHLKGKWLNDVPHGYARESYGTSSYFEGEFLNGVKTGQGYYRWNASQFYVGRFRDNKIEGKGKLETKEYVYQGMFSDNKKQGLGEYWDKASGFRFVGQFRNNIPMGPGKITFQDGAVFNGTFNGFESRQGTLTLLNGQQIAISVSQDCSEPAEESQMAMVHRSSSNSIKLAAPLV